MFEASRETLWSVELEERFGFGQAMLGPMNSGTTMY